MAEEKKAAKAIAGKALKIILGLALAVLGVGAIYFWRWEVLTLIKGCVGVILLLAGLICFAIAKE